MASAREHPGVPTPSNSVFGSHLALNGDAQEASALQRHVVDPQIKAHVDAARLAELESLLEHYDALARRLRLQYEVAGILAKSITIENALPLVLAAIGEIEQWDIAMAWLLDDGAWTQQYEWCNQGLEASSFLAESRKWRFESGQGLPGRAVKKGTVVWIDDFSSESGLRRARTEAGGQLGNAVAIPLKCGDAIYGVIELMRRDSGSCEEGTEELFDALRSDIGRFIEARLFEARLKQEHARLDEAQRIAQLAHWQWMPDTGRLRIDGRSSQVLGLNRAELPTTPQEYLAMVPQEDHEKLHAAFESAVNPDVNTLEVEHALHHVDGTKRIVVVRAETHFSAGGKLRKISGTIQDITERRVEQSHTRATEKRWEVIFRNSPLPAFITDAETGQCLAANEAMLEWLGLGEEEVIGRTSVELKIWSGAYMREEIVCRTLERGYLRNFETITQRQDTPRHLLINVECVELHARPCFLVQFVDITARKRLEATLRLTATAVEQSAEAMVILDSAGAILTVNPAFTRITGYHSAGTVGQRLDALLHKPTDRHDERFFRQLVGQLTLKGHWEGEVWARRKSGEVFPELLSLSVIRDEHGQVVNHVAVFNDISDRKDYEERLKRLALHDGLTGLPNRSLLMEHLGQALARAQRNTTQVTVFFADLDRFKSVNDLFGHDVGDDLLKQVAARFRECVRASDLVARLGGDEFVVVLEDGSSRSDATLVAEKIVTAMAQPFTVDDQPLEVGVSVGISLYPEHAEDARRLLKLADEALYRVKQTGRNGYGFCAVCAQPQEHCSVSVRQ